MAIETIKTKVQFFLKQGLRKRKKDRKDRGTLPIYIKKVNIIVR